ncbi:FecR family protein [Paremcibacter congregatus]|uniref:FecR family protein n=1 Tax=Paremcibacter congregatus TaxID=2043170 RepID=UPI0030EB8ECF|tara:strand:+ start:18279 stop:19310 length:1032 start_codon:yes stop_codon:yes gene_type:complete
MRNNIIHMYPKDDIPVEVFDWFIRIEDGALSPEDIDELKAWIAENPERAIYFPDLDNLWAAFGETDFQPISNTNKHKTFSWWSTRKAIGIAAAVVITVVSALTFLPVDTDTKIRTFETATGERHIATLSDGSSLHMNAQTKVIVDYSENERKIVLQQGEAYFSVAKNPARPFIVRSGDLSVRALGTVFNVEHITGQKSTVTLVEGAIQVAQLEEDEIRSTAVLNQTGNKAILIENSASQAASDNDSGITLMQVNIENAISWRDGKLIFSGEPLSQAIYKLNMHSTHKVILQDTSIGQEPIYGVFSLGDWESAVRAMVKIYPLKAIQESPGRTVLVARKDRSSN